MHWNMWMWLLHVSASGLLAVFVLQELLCGDCRSASLVFFICILGLVPFCTATFVQIYTHWRYYIDRTHTHRYYIPEPYPAGSVTLFFVVGYKAIITLQGSEDVQKVKGIFQSRQIIWIVKTRKKRIQTVWPPVESLPHLSPQNSRALVPLQLWIG